MSTVYCWQEECASCEGGICTKEIISLDDEGCCESFEDCYDQERWQTPYWKRLYDRKNKRVCRVLYHGLKFEVQSRTFFVDTKSAYANATDEITGMSAGPRCYLDERVGKIIESGKNVTPILEELPIATFDEETRTFTYEEDNEGK